ncbi:MAG: DinB family protein [Armatimonadetes bacterium]|nr:DinB family protein [Armatimonadota bacterium]
MSVDRIKRILERTPDDRLLWSPAPTARSPLAQVVHAATSIQHMHNMMMGNTYATPTREEADAEFLAIEKEVTRREDALALLDKNSGAFIAWLDQLSEDKLSDMVKLPFDLGEAPLGFMIMMPTWHTNDHAGQMDYIQTCYGDRSWN